MRSRRVLASAITLVLCYGSASAQAGPPPTPIRIVTDTLFGRTIEGQGGSGVWGQVAMPANPALTDEQARAIVAYILSLADTATRARSLPVQGSYMPPGRTDESPHGVLQLRAAYTDRGANGMPSQYQAKGGTIEVHLDAPTGGLLGTSELIRPTSDQAPVSLRVPLLATAGVHDLYFVFTNPDAKGDGFMFGVLTATFESR